jgi:hypothetical protein
MQMEAAQQKSAVFDEAIAAPDTLLPLGAHPWASVLARALQRVSRLFADESLAQRCAGSAAGAELAPAMAAFAPLCADMDTELETSGFEVRLGESEASARERLAPFLPEKPVVAQLGAARVWLPELFSGMMQASIWREIVADDSTLKLAANSASEFFAGVFKSADLDTATPTALAMEQAIQVYAPKSVEYGLGQLAWMMEPDDADEFQEKLLPFLRASFARETPPAPVLAPKVVPPPPPKPVAVAKAVAPAVVPPSPVPVAKAVVAKPAPQAPLETAKTVVPPAATGPAAKAVPPKSVPPAAKPGVPQAPQVAAKSGNPPVAVSVKPVSISPAPAKSAPEKTATEKPVLPLQLIPPDIEPVPTLRSVPRPETAKPAKPVTPIIPPPDDDDEDVVPQRAFRGVRWLIAAVGIGIVFAALLPFISTGGLDVGSNAPSVNAAVTPIAEQEKGPERMVVVPMEPLPEPLPVSAAPVAMPRLFEQAQAFAESARRAKRSGDNRQAAEDMSRAMLIFKQEFGDQRWRDQRYIELRSEHQSQLGLLEYNKDQITAIQELLGAREPVREESIDAWKDGDCVQAGRRRSRAWKAKSRRRSV